MNEKLANTITIVALFMIVIVGVTCYTKRVEKINNGEIVIIPDSEIDK